MHVPVGEYIRQLRRQRGLTQTELGGEHFSKSYVSAVERDKIVPSHDALRFFADQLNQPIEAFEQLIQQSEQMKQSSSTLNSFSASVNDDSDQEVVALLDLVLKGKEYSKLSLHQGISSFSASLHSLPFQQKQARYAFLKGLQAQEVDDLFNARDYLEFALALAPSEYRPAILDALGTNYYLSHAYESALTFHKRALKLLQEYDFQEPDLILGVELHCANDYRSLQAHYDACLHYERARRYLRASHNMQVAGELYLGLGYCMYASLFQPRSVSNPSATRSTSPEEIDRTYQLSLNFLLQSRTLYQVSSDQLGEARARMTQAMILLDFSTWRQKTVLEQARITQQNVPVMNCATLLDDAEEQCRQVLLGWQGNRSSSTDLPSDQQVILYTALSYLVRVFTQRATVARIGEYYDTTRKELSLASHICDQMLESLQKPDLLWEVVHEVAHLSSLSISYRSLSLPRLPHPSPPAYDGHPTIFAEVYFSAGEVCEELGRTSTSPDYALDCYKRSDQFFCLALDSTRLETPDSQRDLSYLFRFYQRYTAILEQRSPLDPTCSDASQQLLTFFKDALSALQYPTLLHEDASSGL